MSTALSAVVSTATMTLAAAGSELLASQTVAASSTGLTPANDGSSSSGRFAENTPPLHAVTGAFGYSGQFIASRLLQTGVPVRTLTNSPTPTPDPFAGRVDVQPLSFHDIDALTASLAGVQILYNTYWVRFNHTTFDHETAVNNTLALFEAAKRAGVKRIVHVSITNPSVDSPFEYFRGKARLEQALKDSGISYCILRPAVLFGDRDILVNNITWTLRRLPVFGVFSDGNYRIRPIHVDDLAKLAVQKGQETTNETVNAVGPESYSYRELAETLGQIIGKRRPVISVPPWFGYIVGKVIGKIVGDVMITWEEVGGLMADLLHVDGPATGTTSLRQWATENRDSLGNRYASELARRRPNPHSGT